MNSVFISGSISIKTLPIEVIKSFDKIISQNIHVYVGDADGIDTLTQKYFASNIYTNISKVSELKEWLVSHKIFKEYQNKIEIDSKYKQNVLDLRGINSIFGVVNK